MHLVLIKLWFRGIDETADKAEKSEGKISKAFGKMGKAAVVVGKAVATGLAVGTGAAIKLGKEAIDAYGDYEQLVGGVETFLKHFLSMTTSPLPRNSDKGLIDPFGSDFSAFVFKIQANMNKNHRDRIAFMRICSGTCF